jgi:hypothetical protein
MTKQQAPNLEQRVIAGLNNANAGSDELSELVAETETAIADADATATAMRLKAADVLAAPTPRDAQDAMREAEAATLNRDRLNGVLPQLRDRYTEALKAERHDKWLTQYKYVEAEREKLAHEFDTTRARVKAELGNLNARLKECNNDCNAVNRMACEIEEYRELEMLPLFAAVRTIDVDANNSQPDWQAANSFAAAYATSMALPACDPVSWSAPEVRAQQRAEAEKRQREIGEHYARMTEGQEERQNAEERERFSRRYRR